MKDVRKLSKCRVKWVAMIIIGLWLSMGLTGCDNKDNPPDYKSLLKDTSRYIDDIEQKNEKLTAKLTDMMKKLERKSDNGDDENTDGAVEELMGENQALVEEKEALAAEIAGLKAATEKGGTETTDKPKEKASENAPGDAALTQKIEHLTTLNNSLAEEKAAYEKELAVLRKTGEEHEEMAKTLENLEKQNAELTEQKAALEDEVANLKTQVEKGDALAEQIEALNAENKKLVDLNANIRSRMEEVQKIIAPTPEPEKDTSTE